MNIEQNYINAATAHGAATERGEYRSANEAADQLLRLRDDLYALQDHGEGALKRLAASTNKHVSRWAAGHLLPINEAFAVAVLEKIIAEDKGIGGFNAEMMLQQWRSRTGLHKMQ